MEPFVIAFALIGLVMAVLIVANVISGAVVAQYQRIGVLKSLGLTPAQVVVVYLRRVGWPALIGCLVGVVAGALLTIPVLQQSAGAYNVGSQQVPWWVLVVAPAGMLVLTILAALGPAMRAGRLSAIEAIAAGRAPRSGRGYTAHRLAARLRLPRPVGLGVAAPFARPARTLRDAARPAGYRARGHALRRSGHRRRDLPAGPGGRLRRAVGLDRVRPHRGPLVRRAGRGRRQHLLPRPERPRPRRHHHRGHRDQPGRRPHRRRGV
jgi:hypothetical protein